MSVENVTEPVRDMVEKAASVVPMESVGIPSAPVLGLPLARVIPMDAHAMSDYAAGASALVSALVAESAAAKLVGFNLAFDVVATSMLTDYRLSAAKLIPIEVHEVIDYVWGFSAIAAPFLFGYFKKSPFASIVQITTGVIVIGTSLVTDYRAFRGRTWGFIKRPELAEAY